jgi:hypothetical protein
MKKKRREGPVWLLCTQETEACAAVIASTNFRSTCRCLNQGAPELTGYTGNFFVVFQLHIGKWLLPVTLDSVSVDCCISVSCLQSAWEMETINTSKLNWRPMISLLEVLQEPMWFKAAQTERQTSSKYISGRR